MKRFVSGCILVLLILTGCGPRATPSPTVIIPSPPTTVAPPPTTPVPPMPPTATALPLSADTRFGAALFGSTRLNVTDLSCADLQKMGIHSTFFGAWWGEIEPQPGQYDWSSVDGPVDAALACGVEPMIKITTSAGPGRDGTPPQDMEAYARFVFDLAQHLKGRVRAYAIENEINNPRMVWTAETYGPLRAAAYEAIKRADPDAQVLDGGLTMQAYIIARANELLQAGRAQEAIAMLDRFETYMRRSEHRLPDTEQQLIRWSSSPNSQRGLALVDELYANPATYDAVQLHYLQDAWELIPEYTGWVRDWLVEAGMSNKPIEFWEIGFGWEGKEFTEQDHAQGVVKTLVIALGEGASRVIYEPYWEEVRAGSDSPKGNRKFGRGLMTPDGPRLAATAYQTMVSQLSGYQSAEPLDLGVGLWAYRFATPRGDVYVVWAKESTTIRLPLAAAQVTVTDVTGGTTTADPAALPASASPIFVSAGSIPGAEALSKAQVGGLERKTATIGGLERSYHVYVPSSLPDDRLAPLVLAFHGRGKIDNGPAFAERTGFHLLAEKEDFVVVFPDGIAGKWMDGDPNLDPIYYDDIEFIEAIIDEIGKVHKIDPDRIYATGFSNGAAFAQILAMRLPGRIAAIGGAGGGLAKTWVDELDTAGSFSVIMSCGSNDVFCDRPVDAEGNLQFSYLMRVKPTWEAFVQHNACDIKGEETLLEDSDPGDRCRVTRTEWTGCREGTAVVLLWAEGVGHDWYRSGEDSTTQCRDIDDTKLFWEFFKTHPRQ